MGTPITPSRNDIYIEGAQFRSAISEDLVQRVGSSINFINAYQYSEKQFFINGLYGTATTPVLGVDGLAVFEFDAYIIDAWMFNITAGSAGTTELDLKIATTSGGAFTSIFSTTPKISYTSGNSVWVGSPSGAYTPPTGTTQPVFATRNVSAYSAIRLDLLQKQTGGQNCGIIIHYRPR